MIVHVRGVKRYRSNGKIYYYHRATGTRLLAPPGTPEFLMEIERLNKENTSVRIGPTLTAGLNTLPYRTLGYLIYRYQLPSNRSWVNLAPCTRRDYQKIFDWLAPFHDLQLREIDPTAAEAIRNIVVEQSKWRFAAQVLQVMDTLFTWAIREHLQHNPVSRPRAIEPIGHPPERNPTSFRRHSIYGADSKPLPFTLLPPGTRKNNPFYIARGRHPTSGKNVEISTRTRVKQIAEARARDVWRRLQMDTGRTVRRVVPHIENARVATPDLPELTGKTETSGDPARKPFKVRKKPGANPIGKATGGVPPVRKRLRKLPQHLRSAPT